MATTEASDKPIVILCNQCGAPAQIGQRHRFQRERAKKEQLSKRLAENKKGSPKAPLIDKARLSLRR